MVYGLIKRCALAASLFAVLVLVPGCCWSCCKKEEPRSEVRVEESMPVQEAAPMEVVEEQPMEVQVK